jgi:hypothetical protein
MKRVEKLGETIVKIITYPIRATIGVCQCIHKSTPETLDDCIPYTIKKKEENDDRPSN